MNMPDDVTKMIDDILSGELNLELKTKLSNCSPLISPRKPVLNEAGNKEIAEGEDFRQIVYILWLGIRCVRETRRQAQLLSEIYGE